MGTKQVSILGCTLKIHEHDDPNDSVTGRALTGTWLWDSALHLLQFMLDRIIPAEFDLAGKTVLELGAGTGLPGIAAVVLGAARVVLTDVEAILPVLRRNVEANGLEFGRGVEVKELRWGGLLDEGDVVDLVLMPDVFYDADEMDGLGRTLRGVCGEETAVWASSEVRGSTGECLEVLKKEGFEVVEEVTVVAGREDGPVFAVYVMRLNQLLSN